MRIPHAFLLLICAAVASIVGAADAGDPAALEEPAPYVVVLEDDTVLAARTKPVSAFGQVRFIDAQCRPMVLRVGEVDLEATRERNREVGPADAGTLSIVDLPAVDAGFVDSATPLPQTSRRDPPVQVYSATWCGVCSSLHQFLRQQQIQASVIEVDRLPPAEQERAKAEMLRLTGKVSYPTVVIGGKAHAGFSPQWIMAAVGRGPDSEARGPALR